VRHLTLLMEGMWRIVHQRQAEEERKRLQEQLAQASKMEAVGQLAGGVAHDFNNLLTTILGYSEMILEQLAKDSPVRAEVEEISKAGARAASLTQQLLAFSRKQVIMPRPIDLNETVKEARNMLERLIGENIRLVLSLDPDPGRVKADPHQIDQVLLNLAVNARDAMPDGGVLTVATANVAVEKDHAVARSEIVPGNYVVLSVADTGIGMDKETRARIFEPFFSTKEFGKGTGLGLATVYGIAKQNGGTVLVDSEPGRGSVFRIYLPRLYTAGAAVNPAPARTASPTGNETILLVEDDAMVQRLAQKMLSHLGYEVLPAQDTEDAVRICETHPRPIHLLLTDVIMPRMNGVELYSQLQTLRPGMKALFMSGYAEDVVARKGVLPEGTEFIHKPFDMENLALRIRQTLEM
jgi:nitrogen-specific signal transduction histidine kinase